MKPPNARFWTWVNCGPVKITMRPGASLAWGQGGPTDEGWASETTQWVHAGGYIARRWAVDARDCDGRLTHGGTDLCSLVRLHAGPVCDDSDADGEPIHYPSWTDGPEQSYRRDEYAEAMGY